MKQRFFLPMLAASAGLQEYAAQMRASLGDNLTGEKGSERRKAGRRVESN